MTISLDIVENSRYELAYASESLVRLTLTCNTLSQPKTASKYPDSRGKFGPGMSTRGRAAKAFPRCPPSLSSPTLSEQGRSSLRSNDLRKFTYESSHFRCQLAPIVPVFAMRAPRRGSRLASRSMTSRSPVLPRFTVGGLGHRNCNPVMR